MRLVTVEVPLNPASGFADVFRAGIVTHGFWVSKDAQQMVRVRHTHLPKRHPRRFYDDHAAGSLLLHEATGDAEA
jgi:hypothetical protein